MTNAPAASVALGAFKIIDAIQNDPLEYQGLSIATALVAYAERVKVPVQDIFTYAKNILNDTEEGNEHFRALQQYLKTEINI